MIMTDPTERVRQAYNRACDRYERHEIDLDTLLAAANALEVLAVQDAMLADLTPEQRARYDAEMAPAVPGCCENGVDLCVQHGELGAELAEMASRTRRLNELARARRALRRESQTWTHREVQS